MKKCQCITTLLDGKALPQLLPIDFKKNIYFMRNSTKCNLIPFIWRQNAYFIQVSQKQFKLSRIWVNKLISSCHNINCIFNYCTLSRIFTFMNHRGGLKNPSVWFFSLTEIRLQFGESSADPIKAVPKLLSADPLVTGQG